MREPWVLGIEIGGTKLQLGIGQGQGSLLALERLVVDPSRGAAGILDQIQAAFAALLAKAKPRQDADPRPWASASAGPLTLRKRTHPKIFPGQRLG